MTRSLVAALVVEFILIGLLLVVVTDQVAHTRVERLGGVNIWGYRGPVLHQKQANEVRVAVIGGDLAFGWGVAASETLAPAVRDLVSLAIAGGPQRDRVVTSVTLGALGLAPSEYAAWIEHFASLRPDVLCIVADPSRHALADSPFLPDRRSAVFRAFGYSPILPLVLEEKGAIRHSAAERMTGDALAYADGLLRRGGASNATADGPSYLGAIETAIRVGVRTAAAGVVVVTAPDTSAASVDRQGVKDLVASSFAGAPVRVADLGDDPALHAEALRLDRFNFSTAGHAAAAARVAPAVLELIGTAGHGMR